MKILILCLLSISICNTKQITKHVVTKDWWEATEFYQIYPRSFKDSDGDGMGDIKGIISKLDYLKELNVGGVWLSPIFTSPMADNGYDISDFYNIDKIFGTMAEMRELFKLAKDKNIKIILDFVPNHSSDKCEWFQKSIKKEGKYKDYYIWHDGIKVDGEPNKPPNNWVSVFRGSAWTWNEERQQFYLHQFLSAQPDLNYRNPDVVEEMKNVIKFWLDEGAAGFRVDAVIHLFEIESMQDEPLSGHDDKTSYDYTFHHYTTHLDETYDMVYQWRTLLDDYKKEHGGDTRIMMTESFANTSYTMKYYQSDDGKRPGAHMPFNFVLLHEVSNSSSADDFRRVIQNRLDAIPDGKVTNWLVGNHDSPRVGSRYSVEKIDALMMMVMTLPGIAITYQGEEIGMVDNRDGISFEQTQDLPACSLGEEGYKEASRDPVRTPFQWDDTKYAGFSDGIVEPWLPVHPNYKELNLKKQMEEKKSTFKLYNELSKLRQSHTIIDGNFNMTVVNSTVLTYLRTLDDHETYIILISLDIKEQMVDVRKITDIFGEKLLVVVAGANTYFTAGDVVPTHEVSLKPFNAVTFTNNFATSLSLSMSLLFVAFVRYIIL